MGERSLVEYVYTEPSAAGARTDSAKTDAGDVEFPNAEYTVEDVLADGEMAALRYTARETHRGTLMGLEPTGEQVEVSGMETYRLQDGEIVET